MIGGWRGVCAFPRTLHSARAPILRLGIAATRLAPVIAIGLLGIALAPYAECSDQGTSAARVPVTVPDLVRQAAIGDPRSLTWNEFPGGSGEFSPDGKHVAVVVRRGDPEHGTNDAELLVYRTAELLAASQPRIVATFSSATNYQPIALVQWLDDNQTLVFAGTRASDLSQVYEANVLTGNIRQLTELRSQLQSYSVTGSGQWLAALTASGESVPEENKPECRQRGGCRITAETLYSALRGSSETSANITRHELRSGDVRRFEPPEVDDPDLVDCYDDLAGGISPDGRFGLRLCRVRAHRWPAWWADYTVFPNLRKILTEGGNGLLRQWVLYDFERATRARLSTAPYSIKNYRKSMPVWIDGGRRFILVGALEPLINVQALERSRRAAHYAILAIDPVSRETQRIAELSSAALRITASTWDQQSETLTVQMIDGGNQALPTVSYRRSGEHWIDVTHQRNPGAAGRNHGAVARPGLSVSQSLNDPPVLIATDPETGARKTILDPNPWLATRTVGRVEAVSWRSKDGRPWRGGIYYPPSYARGMRYPLVIQTHGFDENTFSLSGIARNFTAQPLASLGIIVLQVAENTNDVYYAEEWPAVQMGYEAAIDHLDARGLIDRDRVGIQGWSRTGPHMGYTLTHSNYKFAAGAFTITSDFGWWWYLSQGARHGENEYGALPFGAGLDTWQAMSPSFNLHRVTAPMLMCGDGITSLWDWYVGLRRLEKPVEYWSFPDATHEVFKVGERMLMNQLVVDWFGFWLKNEESPAAEKQDQYLRWRELRSLQDAAVQREKAASRK